MGETASQKQNERAVRRFLLDACHHSRWQVICLAVLQAILAGSGVLSALLIRRTVDAAVSGQTEAFWQTVAFLVLLALGQLAVAAMRRYLDEAAKSSLENTLRLRLFRTLLHKDYAAVAAVHSAEWMNRLTSDAEIVTTHFVGVFPSALGMAVQVVGAVTALLLLEPRLAWLIVPAAVVLVAFSAAFRRRMKRLHRAVREADGQSRVVMQERLTGLALLHAYADEDQACRAAAEATAAHRRARMKQNHFSNICNVGFGFLMKGGYLFGAALCGYGILSGTLSVGSMVAVMQLVSQAQAPMANISGLVPRYFAMMASAERLLTAEQLPDEASGNPEAVFLARRYYEESLSALVLDGVTFTYPGDEKPVLEELTLRVRKGEYVAFTGHSGCGKSTVFRLLLGLYSPNQGRCQLEDCSGTRVSCGPYRRLFAYVPQGNFFMNGTVREIVAFAGEEKVEDARVWQALKIACADGFVRELENGLDTLLGESGLGLSEGQLQRLSIARAVYADRPVLLLDEATSALDEATERQVLENLRTLPERTVLIVTHRPAALAICDRIVDFGSL